MASPKREAISLVAVDLSVFLTLCRLISEAMGVCPK
jgi:hypothetical protein